MKAFAANESDNNADGDGDGKSPIPARAIGIDDFVPSYTRAVPAHCLAIRIPKLIEMLQLSTRTGSVGQN
jgi:hypothetical protein